MAILDKRTRQRQNKKRYKQNRKAKFGNPETTFKTLLDSGVIKNQEIYNEILTSINYVIAINDNYTRNWIFLKYMIHSFFPYHVKKEKLLSLRDQSTKKQKPNDFDYACMNYWKETTGIELFIPEKELLDPNHVHRPKGWNIVVYNEIRSINKQLREIKTNNDEEQPQDRKYSKEEYGIYARTLREYFLQRKKAFKRSNQTTDIT